MITPYGAHNSSPYAHVAHTKLDFVSKDVRTREKLTKCHLIFLGHACCLPCNILQLDMLYLSELMNLTLWNRMVVSFISLSNDFSI